jgi:hypothetical protein
LDGKTRLKLVEELGAMRAMYASARECTLNYFNVVVNKLSRLGVVSYRITKIDGFFRKG